LRKNDSESKNRKKLSVIQYKLYRLHLFYLYCDVADAKPSMTMETQSV